MLFKEMKSNSRSAGCNNNCSWNGIQSAVHFACYGDLPQWLTSEAYAANVCWEVWDNSVPEAVLDTKAWKDAKPVCQNVKNLVVLFDSSFQNRAFVTSLLAWTIFKMAWHPGGPLCQLHSSPIVENVVYRKWSVRGVCKVESTCTFQNECIS